MSLAAARPERQPALAGRGILIARPAEQAQGLARDIAAQGGAAIILPVIDILGPADPQDLARRLDHLDAYDSVVFVSPTAVERGVPLLAARQADWATRRRVAAVGQGTRRALGTLGIADVLAPAHGAGAAALLDLPAFLAPAPRQVLIVRGEGGREELAEALRARGIAVDYAECYRRAPARLDPAPLLARWRAGEVAAVIVTSVEILDRLGNLLGAAGADLLRATPLFTHHPRIAEAARARGIARVIESPADEAGLLAALEAHFHGHA
jgi:uroporphyrinogen-III synthase